MTAQHRRERFRDLLQGAGCIHPASVFDPVSARLAEDLGFECGIFAGSVASQAVLGAPDLIVLTLTEFADQARRLGRASGLPLLVDADHGYGNALNVRRTVEELEVAGVAALTIEDTQLPMPYGAGGRMQLLSVEEGAGKMRAALSARTDPGLVIVGRTGAVAVGGVADAIARANAYAEAGVDALFFTGITKPAELDAIAAAVRLPIILGGTPPSLGDDAYLAARGVRVGLIGHHTFPAAVQAVHDTLKALRQGTAPAALSGIASPALMKQVTRDADYQDGIRQFLGG
jgi:carboxyvinyl-carboxyphosphonate phosphorylmutase